MSNPLKWFRKYERTFLVVFGVALIFAFTFSLGVSGVDPIMDMVRGGGGGGGGGGANANPVVVSWKDGKLRESEMEQLQLGRNLMIQFTQLALQEMNARGGQQRLATVPPINSEEALLELAVLSRKAQELGIEIDDQGVLDYLTNLTDNKLQPAEFATIWQKLTQGQMNDQQLIALLRRELLALQFREMMQSGNVPVSPVRLWDFYNRLARTVDAELRPIAVEDFLPQVPPPTAAQLREFFEQHQNQQPSPFSPEPGFKVPEKVAFDFVRFDEAEFFEVEKAQITDEEIAEYYATHRDEFREPEFLEDDLDVSPNGPDAAAGAASDATGSEAAEPNSADLPLTPSASEENTVPPPAQETTPPPDSTPSPVPQAEANTTEQAAETTASGTDASTTEPIAETAPAATDETKAEEPPPMDVTEEDGAGAAGAEETSGKFKPLEKVTDEIRRSLAEPRARERMAKALGRVRYLMEGYARDQVRYTIDRRRNPEAQAPALPDLAEVSSQPSLTIASLPLNDAYELGKTELGQSYDLRFADGRLLQTTFQEVAFDGSPNYQPRQFPTNDAAPVQFLFWKTESQAAYVPKFEDVQEEVERVWKKQKAVQLALAQAQTDAERATGSNQTLAEQFTTETIVAENLSWLTGGNIPFDSSTSPRLSPIPGVDLPSDELYRTVFSLAEGQVGVATDLPQDHVYLVRVQGSSPDLPERQAGFVDNIALLPGIGDIARSENRRDLGRAYQDMLDQEGVEWKREPRDGRL